LLDARDVGADFLEDGDDDAFGFRQQGGEEVEGEELGVVVLLGEFLGSAYGFLGFDGEFVETHGE
jgi:hypothetical protein